MFIEDGSGGKHECDFRLLCIHQGRVLQRTYKVCECGRHKLISTEVFMPRSAFLILLGTLVGQCLAFLWLGMFR